MKLLRRAFVCTGMTCAALACAVLPAGASAAPGESSYYPVRLDPRSTGNGEETALFARLESLQPPPQHLVFLVHGYATSRYASNRQYQVIASQVHRQYQLLNQSAAVVGVQWPSSPGPQRSWLPQAFAAEAFRLTGFKHAVRDPYRIKVSLARQVGRSCLRRLLLAVHDRFPDARVEVFAHSLGAELVMHALYPLATPLPQKAAGSIYEPERPVAPDLVTLAGADLDRDFATRLPPVALEHAPGAGLYWVTVPRGGAGGDDVLTLRRLVRGKAALGNAFPRLTVSQLDDLLSRRRLVLDTQHIPRGHRICDYYDDRRIADLARAAATIADPHHPRSELLALLDEILRTPDDVEALAPYLREPQVSAEMYSLWRLERLLSGSSRNLADGYDVRMARLGRNHPGRLQRERAASPSDVVRRGLWPVVPDDPATTADDRHPGPVDPSEAAIRPPEAER